MLLYNSVSKEKEEFISIEKNRAKIYVCGPTVYDDAHLGHARSALAFDLLRRVLKAKGYEVTFVKNFTDIDDKIIAKMNESGKSMNEIVTMYIDRYKKDMNSLGIENADIEPKATESIDDIIEFIKHLQERGFAYVIDDGVYFDTSKDSDYFSISGRKVDQEQNQSRVEVNSQKRDAKDFAMWKFSKKGEPSYPSPWGDGRPGWHIECSAMIKKHLSYEGEYQIDIHGGGADLLFPHHENEACQSRCESDQKLAKYWMHNGFVQIDGEKMSKSLGNSFFLKDALKVYDGEILRFYLLSSHYRSNFNFNEEDLLSSKKRLDKLYRLKKRIATQKGSTINKEFKKSLFDALDDDLNISQALAVIDEMVSNSNELLDKEPKNKALKKEIRANITLLENVLGIATLNEYSYFQIGINSEEKEKIEALIKQRDKAKSEKDYAKSDDLRDKLTLLGIQIMDTPDGTMWEKLN
jgi:cysteinyl-tRNA synthetase